MLKSVVGVLFGWRNWFVKFSSSFLDFGSSVLVVDSLEREIERDRGSFTFEDVEASLVHMKMNIITTFF